MCDVHLLVSLYSISLAIVIAVSFQSTGFTALMFACEKGHLDTVITLLEYGANSHVRNRVSIYMYTL